MLCIVLKVKKSKKLSHLMLTFSIFLWNARKCLTNGILMNIIKNAITIGKYAYHVNIMVFSKEVEQHEDDISAEEKIQSESSRIPSENEHFERQKSSLCQKSKGKT